MSKKSHDKIYSSIKTLKTFNTELSFDDDYEKGKEINNNDKTNALFSIYEYFQKESCTLFFIGAISVFQKCYTCPICNPQEDKYICEFCYFNCHQICRELKKQKLDIVDKEKTCIEEKDYKGLKEFFCFCGREYKHKPPNSFINEYGPCDLIKLDKALKLDNFYCEDHKILICCVCSTRCHNKCKITKTKSIAQNYKSKRKNDKCMCRDECHTKYNEVAFTFPLNDYQKLSGVKIWPIQILNILFNNKRTFHKLYTLFNSFLDNEKITEREEKNFISLLKLFSNTFNRKFKTFYYQEDILEMFNYERLITFIPDIKLNNSMNIVLKFRLIFILLFVHLRRDFQNIKGLTSIDFLCTSPLERIKYKIILGKQTIFNENIYKKYNNNNDALIMEENNILKNIALNDICRLMEISMRFIDLEKLAYEFEVGLKYLCFILKKILLTKEELIKLVHHIKIFFDKFYEYIKTKNPNIYLLLNIFQGIAEIVFMIAVTYNDLTIMDYLNKYQNELSIEDIKSLDDFIHVKNPSGSVLFEIVIKSCDILRDHYERLPKRGEKCDKLKHFEIQTDKDTNIRLPENGGLFPEKIIILFTETLAIFCLADSFYFKQIESISKKNLIDYYSFINKFENNNCFDFIISQKNEIEIQILKLKNNIESKFNYLFTSSYAGKTLEINDKIYQDIFLFSVNINNIIAYFYKGRRIIDNPNKSENDAFDLKGHSTIYSILDKENISSADNLNDNILNNKKENKLDECEEYNIKANIIKEKFLKKLSLKNKIYKFFREITKSSIIEEFVDILIISNLDENISKVLSFLSNRKYPNLLTLELCDIIYSTLSLYFYSKNGMEYFLMGKNLSRINKIINRFNYNSNNKNNNPELGKTIESNLKIMSRTIDFLLDITKGINVYGLSLKHHKVLPRLKKNLLEHISMFNLVSNNNLVEFSIHFKKIIKIFINLKNDFKYEDFEEIKIKSILIFEKNPSQLFNKVSFFEILYLLQSNIISNINSNDKNNFNKKTFISLYFTFFKFIAINTFYFYNNKETNEILNIFYNFNDLNRIKSSFFDNILTVKQKYILLEYLRTIYFSDYLDEFNILRQVTPLSNSEFEILFRNNLIKTHLNPNDFLFNNKNNLNREQNYNNTSQRILLNKYQKISDIEIILEIYSNEILKFPQQLINCNLKHCELFLRQILLDIKYISIFFYCQGNNLFGKLKILFYGLSLHFLQKIDSFYQIYQQITKSYKNNKKILIIEQEEKGTNNESLEENWNIELEKINKKIDDMTSISFNVYDKKKIYCYLTESIDSLIKRCNMNPKYNLQSYLEYYDVMAESNFTPFSLLETWDYEYFYEDKAEENNELIKKDHFLYKLENLKFSFINTFIDINNTNFLDVITKISDENDFRKKYIFYFLSFLNSNEGNDLVKLEINLCILTKMMFYDSEGMQSNFLDIKNDNFFLNLNLDINKYSVLVFSLSKNIFANEISGEITNLNKLYIQFIQSLGEGFNFTFHNNIFQPIKINNIENNNINNQPKEIFEEEKNENSNIYYKEKKIFNEYENEQSHLEVLSNAIYASIMNNLKYALYKLDLENLIDSELPYDKLIIYISNAIDFIIEYISSSDENNNIIKLRFQRLLFGTNKQLIKIFFSKISKEELKDNCFAIQRKKVICYSKIKLTQMLTYYLLTKGKENFVTKLLDNDFTTINLYSEILYNFNDLINHLGMKNPDLINQLKMETSIDGYTNKLIEFYTYEEDFRNMIELQLIFDIFIIIRILEDIYKYNRLNILFEKNEEIIENNTFDGNGEFNLSSKFSKSVYKFLNIIILKVEIKMDDNKNDEDEKSNDGENDDKENEDFSLHKNKNIEKIAKKVKQNLKKDKSFRNLINMHKKFNKRKTIFEEKPHKKENQIINDISEEESSEFDEDLSSDSEDSDENSNIKTIFFPRPYLTFFLSGSSQNKFINKVDRSTTFSKLNSLQNYSDYCLFEMIVNKHLIGYSKFNKLCVNLNYRYIEMINYLFIVVQNVFILFRFYKKTDEPYEEYFTFDEKKIRKLYHENMILAIIQIAFLFIFLIIWYLYKFLTSAQYNIMEEYNKPFVGKRKGESEKIPHKVLDYFQGKEISNYNFFREVHKTKKLSCWERFYILVISTHITNGEIIILILSLILNILFLATKMPIFFVVQVLFILNIIQTLFDIVLAIQLKWKNIILLLLFDFLCLYIFMWFAFFYFSNFFIFDEVMIPESQETITEGYCFSSVQCYLFMLSRGSLSNGGISNDLKLISYKNDVSHYLGRYFYDIFFFLLISLYIGKMFLSFIIDTFGELRNKNDENINDKNNVCFICQIKRDDCILKNIDFDKHIKNVHNMWNYVYFLNYLYVNNSLNFNWIENSVWEKLKEQGISWFPMDEKD